MQQNNFNICCNSVAQKSDNTLLNNLLQGFFCCIEKQSGLEILQQICATTNRT